MGASRRILVVGAGFAGSVHARCLAEAGYHVDVIDKRPHIGGNAYDAVDANGVRVHRYGPHLFHTKNLAVADWLRRFGEFVPYTHRVRALLPSGALAPLPINLDTVNMVFGTDYRNADEITAHLARVAVPVVSPKNAAEYLYSRIGRDLTDLLFRPYTQKMWDFELEEMDAAVVKRLPLRFDSVDGYFEDDEIQLLPRHGYTAIFDEILNHKNIGISNTTLLSIMRCSRTMHSASMPCRSTNISISAWVIYPIAQSNFTIVRFPRNMQTGPNGASLISRIAAYIREKHAGMCCQITLWSILDG